MTSSWLDVLCPPRCLGCGEVLPVPRPELCVTCRPLVLETPPQHCLRCGEPGRFERHRCTRCARKPPPFRVAYAPFEHEGAIARAIHRLKYEDQSHLARPLAEVVVRVCAAWLGAISGAVCAVPSHDARRKHRGYDHAQVLAREVARADRRPFSDAWLERTRDTPRQVGLSEGARMENIRGAFTASPLVAGHAVLLVDDVLTTGATAREAAQTLLDAGAASVSVLTVARARREFLR